MQEEIWKDVVGYEGIYEISNFGRVKSVERDIEIYQNGRVKIQHQKEVIMKQMTNHCGYLTVSLRKPRKKRAKFMVHRLVATAFIHFRCIHVHIICKLCFRSINAKK